MHGTHRRALARVVVVPREFIVVVVVVDSFASVIARGANAIVPVRASV
jgi:hypothetical protein